MPATTAAGPVDALPQDLIDREFSHIIWTNFSGQVTGKYTSVDDILQSTYSVGRDRLR